MKTAFFAGTFRPSTGSSLVVQIPDHIWLEADMKQDTTCIAEWIGNELNWSFIPVKYWSAPLEKANENG